MPKLKLAPDAAMRKKYGIRPKNGGPPSSYGLPLPDKGHPLAVTYAKRVLSRAKQALAGGRFSKDDVVKQVRKANTILYGKPAPTAADKTAARKRRAERDLGYYFGESARRVEESLYGLTPDGSWEQISNALTNAVQASDKFGGPVVPYGTEPDDVEALRPGDLSIAASYPLESRVLVANWRTGDYWSVPYTVADDGKTVSLGDPKPAEIEVTARTKEALKTLRESGVAGARAYPVTIAVRINEAKQIKDDGTVEVMAIRTGPGNPVDKNFYDDGFIESIVPLLNSAHSYFDHASLFEEKNRPERSVLDLAGWFSDAREGTFTDPKTPGATAVKCAIATFHPVTGDLRIANLLRTCREKFEKFPDKDPFVAWSICAYGVGAPGDKNGEQYNVISRCTELRSVDVVTQAGADGRPIFQESSMDPKKKTRAARESGRRIDPDLGVDVRTDAERQAETDQFLTEARRATVRDLLAGPARKSLLEAAGVNDPGAGKDFNDDDVDKIADKTGMVKGGKMHQMLSDALTSNAGDEIDEDEEGSSAVVGSLTQAELDALTPEQRELLTKAGITLESSRGAGTGTGGNGGGTGTGDAGEVARLRAENARLATQLAETTKKQDMANFRRVFEMACDKIQGFTESHRILCERQCAGATSNDEICRIVRAYADAHLMEGARGGGNVTTLRSRESAKADPPTFLRAAR